jgi:hypothetical protein
MLQRLGGSEPRTAALPTLYERIRLESSKSVQYPPPTTWEFLGPRPPRAYTPFLALQRA